MSQNTNICLFHQIASINCVVSSCFIFFLWSADTFGFEKGAPKGFRKGGSLGSLQLGIDRIILQFSCPKVDSVAAEICLPLFIKNIDYFSRYIQY